MPKKPRPQCQCEVCGEWTDAEDFASYTICIECNNAINKHPNPE